MVRGRPTSFGRVDGGELTHAVVATANRSATPEAVAGSFMVAQLGARMHYAVPRALERAGRLSRLLTDFCASRGPARLLRLWPPRVRPAALRRLLNRVPQGVAPDRIRACSRLGLSYARDFANTRTEAERVQLFLKVGRRFGRWAVAQNWGGAAGVFVYNTAGEEILAEARRRGLRAVVEQTIAPFAFERRLMLAERGRFPRWEPAAVGGPLLDEYAERERREWALADVVLCGSPFVRDAIASEGGPAEKCVVVPYGVGAGYAAPERPVHGGPLRVLTVGAVGLRKGTPYAVDAARALRGRAMFRWVGPFKMAPEARTELGSDVEFTGGVPRSEVIAHYAWADVFLLPSLCEGSATATYEALTAGLPVVCTPNTGSVVRDGVEGYIVAPRDTGALVQRLDMLLADAPRRRAMADAARQRAAEVNDEAYARGLIAALDGAGVGG